MTINIDESEIRAANDMMNDLIVINRGMINVYQAAAERVLDEQSTRLIEGMIAKHENFKLLSLSAAYRN